MLGAMHVAGCAREAGSGTSSAVRQAIAIARAGAAVARRFEPAVGAARHRQRRRALDGDRRPFAAPAPRGESASGPSRKQIRAERQIARSYALIAARSPVLAKTSTALRASDTRSCRRRRRARPALGLARCRAARAPAEPGRRQPEDMILAGGIEQQASESTPCRRRCGIARRRQSSALFRIVPGLARRSVPPSLSNQAMSKMPGAGSLCRAGSGASAARDARWRSAISLRDESVAARGPRGVAACSSPARRSRCPGNRRCCCRAACGRTRRRPAASACRAAKNTVASMARCTRARVSQDGWIVGRAFHAPVGRIVLAVAVVVVLAVRLVVAFGVAHDVGQREAVMRGDVVDRRPGAPRRGGRTGRPSRQAARRSRGAGRHRRARTAARRRGTGRSIRRSPADGCRAGSRPGRCPTARRSA